RNGQSVECRRGLEPPAVAGAANQSGDHGRSGIDAATRLDRVDNRLDLSFGTPLGNAVNHRTGQLAVGQAGGDLVTGMTEPMAMDTDDCADSPIEKDTEPVAVFTVSLPSLE